MNNIILSEITSEQLSQNSLKDLISFKERLEKEISAREVSEKVELLKSFELMASEKGFNLHEIIGKAKTKPAKKEKVIKYQNPDNKDQVWSGKGPYPKWLKEALKSGKTLQDFEIKK